MSQLVFALAVVQASLTLMKAAATSVDLLSSKLSPRLKPLLVCRAPVDSCRCTLGFCTAGNFHAQILGFVFRRRRVPLLPSINPEEVEPVHALGCS